MGVCPPISANARAPRAHALRAVLLAGLALPLSMGSPASAQEELNPALAGAPVPEQDPPVVLEADHVAYDRNTSTVTAQGNVSVTQAGRTLLAEKLTYGQDTGLLTAEGSVSVLEPDGNVYFADRVELKHEMKRGVIRQFRARLADDSLFAAEEAKRISATETRLKHAVYSPCKVLCDDGEPKTPLWQIKASRVTLDEEDEEVRYQNAFMELYGVPVLYSPYLSHSMPGAGNKSGLLAPEYRHSDNLGSVYSIPFYAALAPDKDATITPIYTGNEGLVMAGEYRQMFETGAMNFKGSITRPRDRDAAGNRIYGRDVRGHIFSDGAFKLDDGWDAGFNIRRTTDDTYLRRYEFSRDTLLTSRVYAENFNPLNTGRFSYAGIQGLAFQGLTAQDDPDRMPLVAPLADFAYQSDAMENGSRLTLTGNVMSLMREEGADSRRLSVQGLWNLPYVTQGGHMLELTTSLRADGYYVNDVVTNPTRPGVDFDGSTGRFVPEMTASWRYPLIKRMESASLIVEPLANVTLSPRGGNKEEIPNEDSAVSEFNDLNVFSANRFAGYDRLETGPRANYGLRAQADFDGDKYASFLIGQNYRLHEDRSFPLTNDLDDNFSDYVGRLGVYFNPVDVSYRFRLDKDGLSPRRHEVNANMAFQPFSLSGGYLKLDDDPIIGSREEVFGGTAFKLTREWRTSLFARHNLQQDAAINAGAGLIFENECLTLMTAATRDLTSDRDIKPSTTFRVQVGFKNLQ